MKGAIHKIDIQPAISCYRGNVNGIKAREITEGSKIEDVFADMLMDKIEPNEK